MSEATPVFGGSVPKIYHQYLVPLIFDEYARDLADRLGAPDNASVLEIACGTGVLTRYLRSQLPESTRLVATDLNPEMLEIAKQELADLKKIEYQTADGTSLPFADGEFDAVLCQFGVMFYPDKSLGYRETARVLKPGGTYLFNTWDSFQYNTLCRLVHETVINKFSDDPPAFLAGPFGYHDIPEIESELYKVGFRDVAIFVLPKDSQAKSARDIALALATGTPLAAQLVERGIEKEAFEVIEAALINELGSGEIICPMQAITFVAKLPG